MIIAHRGANAECPQNSMLAFETAAEIGADMIEFDIWKTIDDEIVILHDITTESVSINNLTLNVEESTFNELQEVELEGNQKIPKIDEVFKKLKGKINFQIEIKGEGTTEILYKKIQEYNLLNDVMISSFNHNELKKVKNLDKNIPCSALEPAISEIFKDILFRKKTIKKAISNNFDGIHPLYLLVNRKYIEFAHSNGIYVNPWTFDNPKLWKKYIDIGCDGIITNDPRNLIKMLEN